jgi:hypothetical protein
MSTEKRWFVSVDGGDPIGPVTLDQLVRGSQAGKIPIHADVCPEGGTHWTPLRDLPELASPASRGRPDAKPGGDEARDTRSWYVRTAGAGENGPISTSKLLRSIHASGIPMDAQVREDGARTWLPILNVPELNEAAAAAGPPCNGAS